MKSLTGLLLSFLFISSASAQYDRLTGNTIFQAIQCDVGRFGADAAKAGIDPQMKAHVVYSYTVEKSEKVIASARLSKMIGWIIKGPSVEASRSWSQTDGNTVDGNFNINRGNKEVCLAGNIPKVPVGIYECLRNATEPIKAKVISRCEKTRIAAGKVTAKGTIDWILLEADVQGDFDAKVTYNIKVDAPTKEEKPAGGGQASVQ